MVMKKENKSKKNIFNINCLYTDDTLDIFKHMLIDINSSINKVKKSSIILPLIIIFTVIIIKLTKIQFTAYIIFIDILIYIGIVVLENKYIAKSINFYFSNNQLQKDYENTFKKISSAKKKMAIANSLSINSSLDRKRNSGASELLDLKDVSISKSRIPYINSNIKFYSIKIDNIYFFLIPFGILKFDNNIFTLFEFNNLEINSETTIFIDENPPNDTNINSKIWKYQNKNGEPDRRYNNNYIIYECEYGIIHLKNKGRIILSLLISNNKLGVIVKDDFDRTRITELGNKSIVNFNYKDAQNIYNEDITTYGNHINIKFIPYMLEQTKSTKNDLNSNDFFRLSALYSVGQYTNTDMDTFNGITQPLRITCKKHGLFILHRASMYLFEGTGCPDCYKENNGYPKNIFTMPLKEITEKLNTTEYYILYIRKSIENILEPLKKYFVKEHCNNIKFQSDVFNYIVKLYNKKEYAKSSDELYKMINKTKLSFHIKSIRCRAIDHLRDFTDCINKLLESNLNGLEDVKKIIKVLSSHSEFRCKRLLDYPNQITALTLDGSIYEFDFFGYLLSKDIPFVRELSFKDSIDCSMYRYDFFIPSLNLIVEIHGSQHYKKVEIWGGELALKERKERDFVKKQYVLNKGFNYLEISYKDWKFKNDILDKKIIEISNKSTIKI